MAAGSVAAITGVAVIASAAPRAPACLMNFERFIEKYPPRESILNSS